ncbi:MAG TPA: sensor histidine kinase [Gaiellaceae bacterium]
MRATGLALLGAGGAALGVLAYHVQVHDLGSPRDRAAATVAVGWSFLVAGLIAWGRRPGNRIGPLMLGAGVALLARQLRYSHDAALFTVFFAIGDVGYAMIAHTVLAYPGGRLIGRVEGILVRVGYIVAVAFPITILLLHDSDARLRQFDPSPRRSLLVLSGHAQLARVLQESLLIGLYGVLAGLFLVLVVRKLVLASPRLRRMLAPLLVAALAIGARGVYEGAFVLIPGGRPIASTTIFWWQVVAFAALPVALLAGLLRARLARSGVGDLVVRLEHTPPEGLRDALARALGDQTLELAFWLPERGEFIDASGTTVALPAPGGKRAATRLENAGVPVAALVHDASLLDEPRLVEGVAAAARLALENARLQAETQRQLVEVRESRIRIVTAADEERRRIERDLHDGAQQRLVALALELRTAQRRLGDDPDPELERLLSSSVAELQAAVGDLRELARGVHPAVLTEEGLAAALETLADRMPFPVAIEADEGRLPGPVEAAAYFVVCESLANVVKHAEATSASVRAVRRGGMLELEIADDGVGGASVEGGSGLDGLRDRVDAVGGRLRIESTPGAGTRIVAEIPCES